MKKVIAWEKWDADLIEQEIAEMFEIADEDEELASDAMAMMKKIPKLVSTPIGIFQLHDKANPIKQLDCWTGHTNFDITKSVQEKIEKIRGIELLMVLSRYRFFVGVGKLFDFKNVGPVEISTGIRFLCQNLEISPQNLPKSQILKVIL